MRRLLLIGGGGFAGSVLRYLLGGWAQRLAGDSAFPWGTLMVNVIGCFVIGALGQAIDSRGALSPETRAFLIVGVLGGFTTFSAFGNETFRALQAGDGAMAGLNVLANVGLGLAAVWCGWTGAGLLTR